jgi:hypothetical protein
VSYVTPSLDITTELLVNIKVVDCNINYCFESILTRETLVLYRDYGYTFILYAASGVCDESNRQTVLFAVPFQTQCLHTCARNCTQRGFPEMNNLKLMKGSICNTGKWAVWNLIGARPILFCTPLFVHSNRREGMSSYKTTTTACNVHAEETAMCSSAIPRHLTYTPPSR